MKFDGELQSVQAALKAMQALHRKVLNKKPDIERCSNFDVLLHVFAC